MRERWLKIGDSFAGHAKSRVSIDVMSWQSQLLDELDCVLLTLRAYLAGRTVLSPPVNRRQTGAINQILSSTRPGKWPHNRAIVSKSESLCIYSCCVLPLILNIKGYCHNYPNYTIKFWCLLNELSCLWNKWRRERWNWLLEFLKKRVRACKCVKT